MSADPAGMDRHPLFVAAVPADAANRRTAVLAGGLTALALILLFFDTARSMVAVWSRSATFNHGFLVVPIALWLVWRRRDELARVPVRPFWPALVLVAGAGFAWLLGRLAAAAVVEHFALVLMIQAALLAVYGVRFARAIALPLAFLLFAVPFGEAFVPKLIDWTADFTVFALKASGIPVYREGNYFMIPSGQWSVVEACSGIRYLIASLMVGVLFAHLMFVSRRRQILFAGASVLVPIVANWLRAYFIVLIGHLSGNELAVGVDHLIYGWIFFGIVMLLLFWVGARFRDAPRQAPARSDGDRPVPSADRGGSIVAAGAAVFVAALWIPAAATLGLEQDMQVRRVPPIEGANGWRLADSSFDWLPRFSGHGTALRQVFERDGERVFVYIAYYAGERGAKGLVNSGNLLVAPDDARWREIVRGRTAVTVRDETLNLRTATIGGAAGRFDVLWWYWVDGRVTASDAFAKALQARARLQGGSGDAAAVFVYTEPSERGDVQERLVRFAAEMGAPIAHALQSARAGTAP